MIFGTVACEAYVHDPLCCPSGITANFLGSTRPLSFLSHNFVDEYADRVDDRETNSELDCTFLFFPHNQPSSSLQAVITMLSSEE
jgi:hypothetical protein